MRTHDRDRFGAWSRLDSARLISLQSRSAEERRRCRLPLNYSLFYKTLYIFFERKIILAHPVLAIYISVFILNRFLPFASYIKLLKYLAIKLSSRFNEFS